MTVTDRQDEPAHLRRLAAYGFRYRVASRWRGLRLAGTIVLAALVPVLVIFVPDGSALLAAIAAGWLVLGRTGVMALERKAYKTAVAMQELYDVELFRLPWNEQLAGAAPSAADVASDARRSGSSGGPKGWYEVDDKGLEAPADVLLCQWQSAAWSRADHGAWAVFLVSIAVGWSVLGIVYALCVGMSLATFLIALFLPSAPAVLDAIELASDHIVQRRVRAREEQLIESAIEKYDPDPSASWAAVRRVQDGAFQARLNQPRVPGWFYRFRKNASSADTNAAAAVLKQKLVAAISGRDKRG